MSPIGDGAAHGRSVGEGAGAAGCCEENPMQRAPVFLSDLTFPRLRDALVHDAIPAIHAKALWRALYRECHADVRAATDLPASLHAWLARGRGLETRLPGEIVEEATSEDGLTRKCVIGLPNQQSVETVIMSFRGRFTACISTQVGCAMGCTFCATGQAGFTRHLRPGEIVAQIVLANRALQKVDSPRVRNAVIMGMGEPLHNYDAVMTALEIISDPRGLQIGPRKITISTVGVVPAIVRLADEQRPYNLAVSLHACTDEERAEFVPVTKRWPLRDLIEACRAYTVKMRRRIFFEWTMIAGKNDSVDHARGLASLLAGLDAHVNLIPLNPTAGFQGSAARRETTIAFQRVLRAHGLPSTVRQRRGIALGGGCGQLAQTRRAARQDIARGES
jgi:23S rRNA (adenine2503-C2)-methyltransferase